MQSKRKRRILMIRKLDGPVQPRDFDREFWRRMGVSRIMRAAWEMVVSAHGLRTPAQRRLQRDVGAFRQAPRPVSGNRRIRREAASFRG